MSERRGRRPRFDWSGEGAPTGADGMPISPAQCRMARAGVIMSVRELARLAEVSALSVTRFENGNMSCPMEMVQRFKRILESRGAQFFAGPQGGGVKVEGE